MMSKGVSEKKGLCKSDLHPGADRCEHMREKMQGVCGFMDLVKVYIKFNREPLCQVL